MNRKKTFKNIFLILVFVLITMPFFAAFNQILTNLVMQIDGYRFIQDYIVPWEVRMAGVLLLPFGFDPSVAGEYLAIGGIKSHPGFGEQAGHSKMLIEIAWNCIGWQSLLFFVITAWVGLQGDTYTNISKFKAFVIGLLGTFLVNLLRIAMVVIIAFYFGQKVSVYFHDYVSTIITIGWLLYFWRLSYAYVLEEKN